MKRHESQVPSPKSYVIAVCLSAIFGVVGFQHFYMGRIVEGVLDFGAVVLAIYFFAAGSEGWAVLVYRFRFPGQVGGLIMPPSG